MEKPDYGLDAPGVIRNLALVGAAFLASALGLVVFNHQTWTSVIGFLVAAAVMFAEAMAMVWSSRRGKFIARDRLLDDLRIQGNERVLDVGCGHGLLLIGAARRVPQGRAVGIDLWSQEDQGKNARELTLHNAQLEGVAERVEVQTGDMRKLPFGDGEFDAVVASLSIHNIPDVAGRNEAIREIARVLKPGGRIALMDFRKTGEYAEAARAAGLADVALTGRWFSIFPPVRVVTGRKP